MTALTWGGWRFVKYSGSLQYTEPAPSMRMLSEQLVIVSAVLLWLSYLGPYKIS